MKIYINENIHEKYIQPEYMKIYIIESKHEK